MIGHEEIKKIVLEILEDFSTGQVQSAKKGNLLVVNSRKSDSIEKLKNEWNVISESAMEMNDYENIDKVIIFHCTQDLLVKGAFGITDCPDSKLVGKLLLQEKSVIFIPTLKLEWLIASNVAQLKDSIYRAHLLTYKKQLESFGVTFRSYDSVVRNGVRLKESNCSRTFSGKLLNEQVVKDYEGDHVYIQQSTIVTPLAFDAARELGKTIVRVD